ncbi:MAG: TonB-dependent receptor, partial [Bermanella sp.]
MNRKIYNLPQRVLTTLLTASFCSTLLASPDFDDESFAELSLLDEPGMDIPLVLTAARLRQSQLDAPASVTVIDADTIAALGFKDLEDVFRLVPGMLVGYHGGFGEKLPLVSYHGTQAAEHRRLQVLIDGRSVYKPALARVEWADIPLAIEDIERIEVIRGPSAATYGANAYLATINILSKHPDAKQGTVVKLRAGNRQVADAYLNISNRVGNTNIHLTLGSKHKSGFDSLRNDTGNNRDSVASTFVQMRTFSQLNSHASLEWQAGFKSGTNQQGQTLNKYLAYNDEEDIMARDLFAWSKYNHEFSSTQFAHLQLYSQHFQRHTDWNACKLTDDRICGDFDYNITETKSEIEYQHTSNWNAQLRSVAGARVRLDEFDSITYNGGQSDNTNSSLFANVEYRFAEHYVANMGGMMESDRLNGEHFSPRVALNYHLTPAQTVRFIYSEAIRSPNLYEKGGQLFTTMKNVTVNGEPQGGDVTEVMHFGNEHLQNEKIYSHEISYFGLLRSIDAQLDLKLFYDELSGLISQSLNLKDTLTNENKLRQKGLEGQIKFNASHNHKIILSFSILKTDDDLVGNNEKISKESNLSADRSGSLMWLTNLQPNTQLAAAFYHVENWRDHDGSLQFSRLDININHHLSLASAQQLKLQAALQYRLDDDPLLYDDNNYADDLHLYASV